MKHLGLLLAITVLLPLVWWRERREKRAVRLTPESRLLHDLLAHPEVPLRIREDMIFPTEYGFKRGIVVRASCPEECASILVARYLTMEKVA